MSAARRVGLLFGGRSVEHEVSVESARAVDTAIREAGMQCVPVGVAGDGRWLSPERSRTILDGDAKRAEPSSDDSSETRLALVPGARQFLCLPAGEPPQSVEIDVVFPLVHGWGGEDGRVQGALDLAGLPYVGPGVAGSAAGMDKIVSKRLFAAQGLPQLPWLGVRRDAWVRSPRSLRGRVADELGYPVFVKPANGGSSVGISKVDEESALDHALEEAFACDHQVLVERGVVAREIECAVLGNEDPRASVLGEIESSREFYDYRAKYVDGTSRLTIPAELDSDTTERVRSHAVAAFRALDLQGLARVDFLVDREDGAAYLNELNTLPGFTSISMFPKLWNASGLPFPRLIERLVDLAFERQEADRRLRTRFGPGGP